MRIVYYLPSMYASGGLERIITFKANYLADRFGFEVAVLTSEQKGREPYFTLSPNVTHHDINVVFDNSGKSSLLLRILRYPFQYMRFKRRFIRFLKHYSPDITISTLRREIGFIGKTNAGGVKIGEFHVTRHSYHTGSIKSDNFFIKPLKLRLEKRFISNLLSLSKLILLTHEECDNWPELNNIHVIYNPLTIEPGAVSDCSSKQVVAVGRYAPQKGFDMLIPAWAKAVSSNPGWVLKIYGEGDKDSLQSQIEELGIGDSCFLMPPVQDISKKYAESSIFVLSSRFEGFGMVICEAMACGVPPVSFDCPCGPKEIIKDGFDGLLVKSGDIDLLAEKIGYLIQNESIRKEMGKNAKKSSQRFIPDVIMDEWKTLFESLIEE